MTKVNETKCKILEVALKLFGSKGFDGTSVRDIAKEADVNLASVNYHFSNKQNLYFEVINSNCSAVEIELKKIYKEEMNLEEFSIAMFSFFVEQSHSLLNTFRLILNESIDFSDIESVEAESLGPPAGEILLKLVTDEVGENVPLDGRFWVVSTLISNITHMAIIMSSSVIKERCDHLKHLNIETQSRNIRLHCHSLVAFLKTQPDTSWDPNFKMDV